MPVGVFLQEAYNIYCFMQDDRKLFVAGGFDWMLVEKLPERIEYLREVEAALWKEKYGRMPVEKEYEQRLAFAVKKRRELLRDMEFACRNSFKTLQKIRRIKKASTAKLPAFNASLSFLGHLAEENVPLLNAIGSDPRLIDDVKESAEKLRLLHAQRIVEQAAEEKRDLRDRAYTYLAAAMEEIRRCALYVIRDDPKRLRGYASEYFRKSNRAGKRGGGKEAG